MEEDQDMSDNIKQGYDDLRKTLAKKTNNTESLDLFQLDMEKDKGGNEDEELKDSVVKEEPKYENANKIQKEQYYKNLLLQTENKNDQLKPLSDSEL